MLVKKWLVSLIAVCLFAIGDMHSGAGAQTEQALHIDIPVKLEKANVVVDAGHAVFVGDMPFLSGTSASSQTTSRMGTPKAKSLSSFTETPPT